VDRRVGVAQDGGGAAAVRVRGAAGRAGGREGHVV